VLGFHIYTKGRGLVGELVGDEWVVKVAWGVGGWCVVCIGNVMDNGIMVVCEKTNGRCELQNSMKHDK
jgi:hypothetical protein